MRPTRAAVTRQAGQALALGLALMALAGMAWLALYGLGQRAGARAQLLRATDAAAYSGAVVQARALNLLAYIHRAQVGHQVALAHLASLAAWARFAQTQAARRTAQNPPVALIGLLFGPRAARGYGAAQDAPAGDLMQAYAAHDELAHRVLQQAADTLARDARATRDATMRAVLRAHYPQGDDGLTSKCCAMIGRVTCGASQARAHAGCEGGRSARRVTSIFCSRATSPARETGSFRRAAPRAAMNCAGAASPGWTAMAAGAQAIRCRSMLCAPIAG